MTRRELYEQLTTAATPIYGVQESQQIARMIMEELLGITRVAMIADPTAEVEVKNLDDIVRDIAASRPVQYVIGEADFCDFRLGVREGVLIPRPESEELVAWIASEGAAAKRIVDVGTGSGALAIALARALPHSQVEALDISEEAIAIAQENIERLANSVTIKRCDALAGIEHGVANGIDIIVSNPPYIPRSEMAQMRDNVVKHEPHLALFVEDNDPLIFYRRIAESGCELLNGGGKLYFEIHENFAEECCAMLSDMGYINVVTRLDINDKARMVCAQKEI